MSTGMIAPELEYDISLDREKLLLEVRVGRLTTPEESSWIGEEARAALLTLGDKLGRHVTLYDISAAPVFPPATVDSVAAAFAHPSVQPLHARKVAFLVTGAVARRQVERISHTHQAMRAFENRDEALAWLMAP